MCITKAINNQKIADNVSAIFLAHDYEAIVSESSIADFLHQYPSAEEEVLLALNGGYNALTGDEFGGKSMLKALTISPLVILLFSVLFTVIYVNHARSRS